MLVWGIVLAGGSGARFGRAKQFDRLGGLTLVEHSVVAASRACAGVVCVVPAGAAPQAVPGGTAVRTVPGGATRAGSVRAGLAAVPAEADVVVVADAAHPLASPDLFGAVVAAVAGGADGAVPGLAVTEAIARVAPDGTRAGSVPRQGHVLVQMPHAFTARALRLAHAGADDGVEDSAMVAALTIDGRAARVVVVPGEATNVHVTTPEELELARRLLGQGARRHPLTARSMPIMTNPPME